MTKEQASETWCPMTRVSHGVVFGGDVTMAAICIAGKCAMWRWSDPAPAPLDPEEWNPDDSAFDEEGKLAEGIEPPRPDHVPADATWIMPSPPSERGWQEGGYWVESDFSLNQRTYKLNAQRCGYCGLAGRPE